MKLIYIFRGSDSETYEEFGKRMKTVAADLISHSSPRSLWMTITDRKPPRLSIIPFKKGKIAVISVITDLDVKYPGTEKIQGYSGTYSAAEALPVSYHKDWPAGTKTPGVCLLTLFRRKKGISYDRFLDRWHNSHTPLSLKIHPLWHYNRNVVRIMKEVGEKPWDGVVEEHFREEKDLFNPFRFFGNPLVIIQRMIHVYTDTNAFLDYGTIQPWLVSEYVLV